VPWPHISMGNVRLDGCFPVVTCDTEMTEAKLLAALQATTPHKPQAPPHHVQGYQCSLPDRAEERLPYRRLRLLSLRRAPRPRVDRA